jgi:site-specific DNA recombinase
MIPVPSGVRVRLAAGHADMRRGMNSLAVQVQHILEHDPHAGDLYVFRGKRGHLIKILWHDGIGMSLYACAKCGCSVVGEIKKQRYIYYHCTGYTDKCQGNPASCRRRYVREEALEQQFTELLGRLRFDEVLAWVREALHASHADKRREQEEAIVRLRAEYDRLQRRIDAMYVDKLDGCVDVAFFDKMSAEWRAEQDRRQREIDRHQDADKSYMDEGTQILELARNAQRLFEFQEPREKRRLLNFVLSNCAWDDGKVIVAFREPLDLLARTTALAASREAETRGVSAENEIWRPRQDSNLRPPV